MNKKVKEGLTKSQLANLYNVSRKTMSKWLNQLPDSLSHPVCGYYFSPEQVQTINDKFGQQSK